LAVGVNNRGMDIQGWDERYRLGKGSEDWERQPNPLLVKTCPDIQPGNALDLACGMGRNALWLAARGWNVTAVDGAPRAIESLRRLASETGVEVNAKVADIEKDLYEIGESCWDLIAMCYYLQTSLFEPAKRGVRPGGIVLAIVHIAEAGEEASRHRLRPGELRRYFSDCEILHYAEGRPNNPSHKQPAAEIVARRYKAAALNSRE
jgi:SAM-dependent methyltransferase